MGTRKKILLAALALVCLIFVYWISTYFFAYTADAFVEADLVRIAPVVGGQVVEVHVTDNQQVEKGAPLLTIDPAPFALELALKQAALDEARARLDLLNLDIKKAEASVHSARSRHGLAKKNYDRYHKLVNKGDVTRMKFDQAKSALDVAAAELETAGQALAEAQQAVEVQKTSIPKAQAQLGLAQYRLDHARVSAPARGFVNFLRVNPGDYAQGGKALVGVVDDASWRVQANFRERLARHIHSGQTVWVYLDGHPWRLFKGRVQGVTRGVSRTATPDKLLPYVKPTTDWIRLSRRFPVRITLDDAPQKVRLHSGADARVLVVY